ncbi:hypothetical protein [Clostridium thermosuccinogenes]|uniref:hypothetical protein n=1 Tax=Clostridium thermosuccinogenes TaxID=84032 RepID=UPI000CCC7A9C|nr:hypothetical protein [Pseudoclostridium thermosuccinogenes]PNT90243.1 exosortase [Pseudoclostridium thermosuccinogenes]
MYKFKNMLAYLLVCAVAFYILPLSGKDTGSFMLILLIAIPLVCFITSLIYGIKNRFNLIFPVIVGVIFIPTIFIYYNRSAWVYIIGYAVISLIGNLIGRLLGRRL